MHCFCIGFLYLCSIFTQICIGGENVGKIWCVGRNKKCCKRELTAPCFRFETSASWYKSYPEPCYSRTNSCMTLMFFGNYMSGFQTHPILPNIIEKAKVSKRLIGTICRKAPINGAFVYLSCEPSS